jgi:hypothetical protein
MNGTVTPVDVPLGAGTDAYQTSSVRLWGFAQSAGTVATPQLVVASNGSGHASLISEIGCLSMRSAVFGVAVRQPGVAANGAGHVSLVGGAGCLPDAAPAAPLHANTAKATSAAHAAIRLRFFVLAFHIRPLHVEPACYDGHDPRNVLPRSQGRFKGSRVRATNKS